MTPDTKFTYETQRPCPTCKRPTVDAVRSSVIAPYLMFSRHIHVKGFCTESLQPIEERSKT